MQMVGSVSRVATMVARYTKGRGKNAFASSQWLHTTRTTALYHETVKCLKTRQFRSELRPLLSTLGIATIALAVTALEIVDEDAATRSEAQQLSDERTAVARWAGEREKARTGRKEGRRLLLKQRRNHQAESQQEKEFKMHLDEYEQIREAVDSLRSRFDTYASRSVEVDEGQCVRAMTFTDFLHSLVLTQFHVHSPVRLRTQSDSLELLCVAFWNLLIDGCCYMCDSNQIWCTRATLWGIPTG